MHVWCASLISTDLMHFMFGRVRFPTAYLGNSLPAPRCTTNWHSNMGNNLRMCIIKLTVIVFLLILLLRFQNPNRRDAQMYHKYANWCVLNHEIFSSLPAYSSLLPEYDIVHYDASCILYGLSCLVLNGNCTSCRAIKYQSYENCRVCSSYF